MEFCLFVIFYFYFFYIFKFYIMKKFNLFSAFIAVFLLVLGVYSCGKEDKQLNSDSIDTENTVSESRSFITCAPINDPENCDEFIYTDTIPTILGCSSIVSYSVLVCTNTSGTVPTMNISVYNVDRNFGPGCQTLVDSIFYYYSIGNSTRADYLFNTYRGVATNGVELLALQRHLLSGTGSYDCGNQHLVNFEFFASSCSRFCLSNKSEVFCGFGCCKRSTGYCFKDGVLRRSQPAISQSSLCQTVIDECGIGVQCEASACKVLEIIMLPGDGIDPL